MLTLYTAPNTIALATHIALVEAGAPYTLARVDFAGQEQRSERYLAINPLGRVPALVTEDGILTETPALLAYLAQRFPAAQLAPVDDTFAFARCQSFNTYLSSTVHVAHAHKMRGYRWTDDEAALAALRRKVPETMTTAMALVERALDGPYVLGEAYSICDAYLYTIAGWLERDEADLARLPRVMAHRERVGARPATRRALDEVAALAA